MSRCSDSGRWASPIFSAHVRFGERGAPVDSLELGYELRRSLNAQVVANIGAADPKNYIFRDVGRVVRYPLQVAGDH
jgi:hypothetical protein